MKRREFIKISANGLVASAWFSGLSNISGIGSFASVKGRGGKPNILVIVADDLGYCGIGVQGCKDIPTPNIDALANNGVRFTDGYVSCPVCSPTRAGLMTGKYQQRFGHEFNPGPGQQADPSFGLPLNETTLAERLKSLGYVTGMVGKWHLGFQSEMTPTKRGFDEFFGFLGGAHKYILGGRRANVMASIYRGTNPVTENEYLTDAFGREAVAFIEKHNNEPFFLYLPFNAVHAPLESIQKYLDRFSSIQDPKRQLHAAMLSSMDDAIGKVMAKIREHKLEEDTLIFFFSDNGGPTPQTTSSNYPLRGYKGQVLEGGIRIPFIIQWKRHLPAGKVYTSPVISLDIHPTAFAAAGGKLSPDVKLDGVNLIPFIKGENNAIPHDQLTWRFGRQWAIRRGDWKLESNGRTGPVLYNLAQDIEEKNDIALKRPEKVKQLQSSYDAWNAQLIDPRWGGNRGRILYNERNIPQAPNRGRRRNRRAF